MSKDKPTEGEITSIADGNSHSHNLLENIVLGRRSGIFGGIKKGGGSTDVKSRNRSKSEVILSICDLSGRSRSNTTSTQNTEEFREICDFPVKPYYKDDSDQSTVLIPEGLQVKESKYTLCYQSNVKKQITDSKCASADLQRKNEEGPVKLERSFIELRFTKSRRLVRICILCIILVPIFSAGVDDCEFVENDLEINTLRSVCIENNAGVMRRRIVFMTIQLPISLLWFGSTFFKFYTDCLP